jgi:hypothetical protein
MRRPTAGSRSFSVPSSAPPYRASSRRSRWRSASLRRVPWSATWTSSSGFSATRATPFLPENDAGLDVDHWTGHTGCVILAPHLVSATKNISRPPPLRRGDGPPAQGRHVLERGGGALQRRQRVQSDVPGPPAA